jgi:mannose-6-phosphate isomerase-like protein (cupin superfamily)
VTVLVETDTVLPLPAGQIPDYNSDNPLIKLLGITERCRVTASRHYYPTDDLQILVPFSHLDMMGPSGGDADILDARRQDNKTDFQKQNVRAFTTSDTWLMRGWATARAWSDLAAVDPVPARTFPFLKVSYQAGPDSRLAKSLGRVPGPSIKLYITINGRSSSSLLSVPYDAESGRYEVELWGDHGEHDLAAVFSADGDDRSLRAFKEGRLVARPDLLLGLRRDFGREGNDDRDLRRVSSENAMHPLLPLRVELAWSDETGQVWDSRDGLNYVYEFNMVIRGWDAHLKAGVTANPHGGVGFLHYRNLLSNYFEFEGSAELGRNIEPWQFDSAGIKANHERSERFFTMDYIDLHILKNNCGIGLHRHRDNQEIFFLLEGQAMMVTGDWANFPGRERCFELRTLRPGHFSLLKPGCLHGLMNTTNSDITLLMFGGYD